MVTYISFLRGVNMTGHNSMKMNDLAVLYKDLGFSNAETYIQSGNVIFCSEEELLISDLTFKIERAITEKFGYQVPVMVRTIEEMEKYTALNPFLEETNFNPSKMAVLLLHETPSEAQIQKVKDVNYPPDKFKIIDREIFLYCPNGFGRTKLYTNFFENKMGVTGTARNWKTMTTILGLAVKQQSR